MLEELPEQGILFTEVSNDKTTIQLHEEELEIIKQRIQTGEVNIYKEFIQEEKTITVPIIHEVLVIENKIIDSDTPQDDNKVKNTIRIPIREDRVEVVKHHVLLNDISILKNEYQEIKHVEDTIKKEILHIESSGNPIIIDNEELK